MFTLAAVRLDVIPETAKLITRGAALQVCAPPVPSAIAPVPVPAMVTAPPQGVGETLGDGVAEGVAVGVTLGDGEAVGVTVGVGVGVGAITVSASQGPSDGKWVASPG